MNPDPFRSRAPNLLLVLLFAVGCSVLGLTPAALAGDPPTAKGSGYQQVPAPADGDRTVFAAANTASFALFDTNGATAGGTFPICIPFEAMAQLKAKNGEALATLTMGQTTDMPVAVDTTGACYVTDSDASGTNARGSCISVSNGERRTVVVDFTQIYRSPGARGAMCSGTVIGLGRKRVRPPCFDDQDCIDSGAGGTCTSAAPHELRKHSCAFVLVQVDTANASLTVNSGK